LKRAWFDFPALLGLLPTKPQWDLHAYFVPSLDIHDDQLRQHWQEIGTRDPSLPNRVGKAFTRLENQFRNLMDRARGDPSRLTRLMVRVSPIRLDRRRQAGLSEC